MKAKLKLKLYRTMTTATLRHLLLKRLDNAKNLTQSPHQNHYDFPHLA